MIENETKMLGALVRKGLVLISAFLFCAAEVGMASSNLTTSLKDEISKNFNSAEIEFTGPMQWVRNTAPTGSELSISFLGNDLRGNAHFSVTDTQTGEFSEGWVGFMAWVSAKIALKRIHPGELLNQNMFLQRRINLSYGQAYDYRGVIYPGNSEVVGVESIQTILEGQFLTSSAIQKIPDIRRGDSVQVKVISGGLVLTTLGVAEEPGYISRQIRVMTGKNKRELLGKINSQGIIEVKL